MFLFVFLFVFVDDWCLPLGRWARTSSSWARSSRCFPRDFGRVFGFLLSSASSGAFRFSLGGWGSPCRVFSSPLPCGVSLLLGGWVPLAAFSLCFPHVSWVGGGAFLLFFFFLLLSLASCISLACRLS